MDGLPAGGIPALLSSAGRGRGRYWPTPPQAVVTGREYCALLEELGALLLRCKPGCGTSAESFAAACLPYLSWADAASADCATRRLPGWRR